MSKYFSKTFILGEYAVLDQGTALIAVTDPAIEIDLQPCDQQQAEKNAWTKGPALDFMKVTSCFFDCKINSSGLEKIGLNHQGLGSSTAVFLAVVEKRFPDLFDQKTATKAFLIRDWYLQFPSNQTWVKPSAADLLAQYMGFGFWNVNLERKSVASAAFSNSQVGMVLLKTNIKTATHLHLNEMKKINFSSLKEIVENSVPHFANLNENFIGGINQFQGELEKLNFVDGRAMDLLRQLKNEKYVLAVKGCGALGTDSLCVFYIKSQVELLKEKIKVLNLVDYYWSDSNLESQNHVFGTSTI